MFSERNPVNSIKLYALIVSLAFGIVALAGFYVAIKGAVSGNLGLGIEGFLCFVGFCYMDWVIVGQLWRMWRAKEGLNDASVQTYEALKRVKRAIREGSAVSREDYAAAQRYIERQRGPGYIRVGLPVAMSFFFSLAAMTSLIGSRSSESRFSAMIEIVVAAIGLVLLLRHFMLMRWARSNGFSRHLG